MQKELILKQNETKPKKKDKNKGWEYRSVGESFVSVRAVLEKESETSEIKGWVDVDSDAPTL